MKDVQAIAKMLRDFLLAAGFDAMADECAAESDFSMLQRYARIVLRSMTDDQRRPVSSRFALLGLV